MIRKILAALALALPGVAHADWYEASTPHFVVYANDTPKYLSDYAARLERFDKAMRLLRGVRDRPISPVERVTIYVVHDADDIVSLAGSDGVRGFYRQSLEGSNGFVSRLSGDGSRWDLDANSVMRHEYSHHFMFDNYDNGAMPVWYVEGFAEFHATAITRPDGSVVFGQAPAYRAAALLDYDDSLSVKEMLGADTQKLAGIQVDVLYGKGWALVHYLTFEPSRRGQLARYIDAINAGKSPMEAAAVFGDLDALNRELSRYIRRPKMTVVTIDAARLQIADPQVRKLTPGEAATMQVRILSKNGVTPKTAPGVYKQALDAARPYPDDPGAQMALAEAAFDAHDYAQSLAAANRALAADPKREKAYVYRGKALMEQAKAAKATDAATWGAVRAAFHDANRLDQDDPEALAYFYRSFAAAGTAPSGNAHDALRTALEFAPQDEDLRYEVALDYLALKKNAEARATLKTLAYSPHGGAAAKRAGAIIAAIDKNDAAEIARLAQPGPPPKTKDK